MNAIVEKVIGVSEKRDQETRTYTISAHPSHLDQIEHLFSWMNMTRGGHSGSAKIGIDGDGAARVEVKREGVELKKPEEGFTPKSSGETEFDVYLE